LSYHRHPLLALETVAYRHFETTPTCRKNNTFQTVTAFLSRSNSTSQKYFSAVSHQRSMSQSERANSSRERDTSLNLASKTLSDHRHPLLALETVAYWHCETTSTFLQNYTFQTGSAFVPRMSNTSHTSLSLVSHKRSMSRSARVYSCRKNNTSQRRVPLWRQHDRSRCRPAECCNHRVASRSISTKLGREKPSNLEPHRTG
jgi:hypothetical protein